jgi:hypothetical protein
MDFSGAVGFLLIAQQAKKDIVFFSVFLIYSLAVSSSFSAVESRMFRLS